MEKETDFNVSMTQRVEANRRDRLSGWSARGVGSGGYLCLEGLFHLPGLNLLVPSSSLRHIMLLVDSIPPVLLATLFQQRHSDRGRHRYNKNLPVRYNPVPQKNTATVHSLSVSIPITNSGPTHHTNSNLPPSTNHHTSCNKANSWTLNVYGTAYRKQRVRHQDCGILLSLKVHALVLKWLH